MMRNRPVLHLVCGLLAAAGVASGQQLEKGFANPPDTAKPWAYWWWLDGWATTEGITRDLEEMKRQGISGVLLFDAGEGKGSPVGPVFMSPAWRELFKHAVREADRLGIEMGVNLCSGWNAGGTWVTAEHAAKLLVWSSTHVEGPGEIRTVLPRPDVQENYYRDIAVLAFPDRHRQPGTPITSRATSSRGANPPENTLATLKHWELKAARRFLGGLPEMLDEEFPEDPNETHIDRRQVTDVSKHMDDSGVLTWQAPQGRWTVLRFGYTLLGARTKCVSPGSLGYEIDFFSTKAMDLHFAETAEKLIADAGPLAGRTLKYLHDDSYEVAGPGHLQPTWTPEFRAEFLARRGYDPLPYLPALAGHIVENREVSNRFLWDYRRTIGDLFADNHYRRMRDLAQRHGIGTHPESGGPFWPCVDALLNEGINDIPMGEYWKRVPEPDGKIAWADNYHICDTVRQAAAAAHSYGKRLCQAEAYTSMGPNWEEDFFDLKDIGDRAFCAGLTRNVLCFYVHQPRLDIKPGYQWEAAGTHFDRNVTWWDQAHAWLAYLARCQYLLQQGLFAADLCYFYGEDVPNYVPAKTHMRPPLPKGYDCDTVNADVLLNRMGAKEGRLVLPDGMSYRYLVLPHRSPLAMSVKVLRKIRDLVEAGATVVGSRPQRCPGLTDYPDADHEVRRLTDELWGAADSLALPASDCPNGHQRRVGTGRVIWGASLQDILRADDLEPDFEYRASSKDADLDFIHRIADGVDIYFVSNQLNRPESAECIFRIKGKQPEIWCAVTGERRDATDWHVQGGRTVVPLQFAPRQSWFIVFRRPAEPPSQPSPNFPKLRVVQELTGPWTVKFDPKWGGPESAVFEKLEDWTARPEEGIRYYSGKATYTRSFDLPELPRGTGQRIHLNLGTVKNVARVRLNGHDLGVVWTAPWSVDVTGAVRPGRNELEIDVVNLWPNRLIGDARLPPEKRSTVTNVKKFKPDSPLLPSGLRGPVTLEVAE